MLALTADYEVKKTKPPRGQATAYIRMLELTACQLLMAVMIPKLEA